MRVIIAGTRTIHNKELVYAAIKNSGFDITCVLCGGARGVDLIGKEYALEHRLPVEMYLADWNKFGNKAGPLRNMEMAKNANALILVWDGSSKGSLSMLTEARHKGLKIFEMVVK